MSILDFSLPVLTMADVIKWFSFNPKEPLLFNSGLFLGMFLVFYLIYIGVRKTFHLRLIYVVVFSLFFYYKSSGMFFLLLVGSSIIDYYLANIIYRETHLAKKKLLLTISVLINLGMLGYFKYTNFILDGFNLISGNSYHLNDLILPVGISFFTFQSISYIIEVYRKEIEPTKNFVDYLFFISFFPQLVAGPIVRAKDFIPQIYQRLHISKEYVNEGLFLIIGGLLKKAVISDYISVNFVDRVFDAPNSYSAFENLMATYGYAIQIYCDFSGYSDMAIGIALLLGYRLPINFDVPYQSASITEFWRRWHISLSTWLKDFLYISIGGNRKGTFAGYLFPGLFFAGILGWGVYFYEETIVPLCIAVVSCTVFILTILLSKNKEKTLFTNFNLFTTMLLGGLWHGASMRFIIWGALHGIALAIHKTIDELFPSKHKGKTRSNFGLWKIVSVLITFHFVAFCWIFFRAKDFTTALDVIHNIGDLSWNLEQWKTIIISYKNVFLLIFIGFLWHFIPKKWMGGLRTMFDKLPMLFKAMVLGFVFWIVFATAAAGPQPFIYFQF